MESVRPSTRSLRSLAQDERFLCASIISLILGKGRQARVEGRTRVRARGNRSKFCETNPIRHFRGIPAERSGRSRRKKSILQIKANFSNGINDRAPRQSQLKANPKPISGAVSALAGAGRAEGTRHRA